MNRLTIRPRSFFGSGSIVVFVLLFIFAFVFGWVSNVVQVYHGFMAAASIGDVAPIIFIKTVCIFLAPVGAIMGWVGLF